MKQMIGNDGNDGNEERREEEHGTGSSYTCEIWNQACSYWLSMLILTMSTYRLFRELLSTKVSSSNVVSG